MVKCELVDLTERASCSGPGVPRLVGIRKYSGGHMAYLGNKCNVCGEYIQSFEGAGMKWSEKVENALKS